MKPTRACFAALMALLVAATGVAARQERPESPREVRARRQVNKARLVSTPRGVVTDTFDGRELLVHLPTRLPTPGSRALVVVLHGGLGNATQIHAVIDMDQAADEAGFVVAYLNGLPAAPVLGSQFRAWNAGGGCCGQPFRTNVDDVAYVGGAVRWLAAKYGIDPARVFGMGHSNGAMMTQRIMCEADVYRAAIPIAGTLNLEVSGCPAARGKRILAIHGARDANMPIAGGRGTAGATNIPYKSEQYSEDTFRRAGASYTLEVLPNTDHALEHIAAAILQREDRTLGRKAAEFFGLAPR